MADGGEQLSDSLQEKQRRFDERQPWTWTFERTALDALEDTVFVFEVATGKAILWNKAFTRISGYTDAEIMAMKAPESYYSEADLAKAEIAIQSVIDGKHVTVMMELITKDGRRIPTEYVGTPVTDADGSTRYLISIGRDVSARLEAQLKLSESEERLQHAMEAATDGYWDWDLRSDNAFFSDRYYTMLGYQPDELTASYEQVLKLVHPEDVDLLQQTVREYGEGQRDSHSIEFRMLCKDGSWRWILSKGKAVQTDAEGNLIRMVGTHRDITERKQLEEALREREEQFRTLSESSPMGVFLTDQDGGVLYVNDQWCIFAGMAREDALGFGWAGALHPEDKSRVLADWEECLREKKGYAGEFRFIQSTGETRLLYTRTAPILSSAGEVVGHVGANEDISERRNLEERLRQTEKMEAIGQLAGGIAHDFNNQLAGILGYTDLLRMEAGDNQELALYVDKILLSVKRAANLTAQLLAFSRKGKYLDVEVDLHRIVTEVISLLKHSIDKKISVRQQLEARPATVIGDPTQLQNAVLNLALNARDAMPEGGDLLFATEVVDLDEDDCREVPWEVPPGSYVQVSVIDSGTGMDEQTLAHIFEPFFTTKEPGKGTGMGLAAVYGTIESHRGAISVESEPGHGARFTLYLPLVAGTVEAPVPAVTREGHHAGSARILLVEDEEQVRDVASRMLVKLGHAVIACEEGAEATEIYEKEWRSIDLVILDMVMPVMDGREAFVAMRKINPEVRALLSSGYSIDSEAQTIIEEGVLGFLQKPFRIAELSQKIEETLKQ
jgi:PAS domain S-box-containing protein